MKYKMIALLIPLFIIGVKIEIVTGQPLKGNDFKEKFEALDIKLIDPDFLPTHEPGGEPLLKVFTFKSGNWSDDTDWENKKWIIAQAEFFPEDIPEIDDFMCVYSKLLYKEGVPAIEKAIINGTTYFVTKVEKEQTYVRHYAYFDGPIGFMIGIFISKKLIDEKATSPDDVFNDLIGKLVIQYK